MSIRQPLKTSERKQIDQAMSDYLARGGIVKKLGPFTVEQLEQQWADNLPAGMRARLERIKMRKETT